MLVVIDEAHNVCPADPEDPLTALATEHAVRIAGEGRKFGLYLLVSTQRPQKVHENVLSQCDNLLLMRMNSTADLGFVADVFSFVPRSLLERATAFRQGESLAAGRISPHPALVRFGARRERGGRRRRPGGLGRPAHLMRQGRSRSLARMLATARSYDAASRSSMRASFVRASRTRSSAPSSSSSASSRIRNFSSPESACP